MFSSQVLALLVKGLRCDIGGVRGVESRYLEGVESMFFVAGGVVEVG